MSGTQRVFVAAPAVREQVPLLIGLVGPSGSGKTYTALRLATGIQRVIGITHPIVVIDTENRRALHYADFFKFMHIPFTPPFGADDYQAVIKYAASQSPSCIIVDSMTHEHAGEGGLLDRQEKLLDRIAGDDWAKRERNSMSAWAKVKPQRLVLVESIKQISGSMIFCFRGQEKTKPVKNQQGKVEIVPQGLCAIGGKDFIYEMTVSCLLPPRSDGVPDWSGTDDGERLEMKLPQQFRELLKPGSVLSEDIGQAMAEWARGGVSPTASTAPAKVPLSPIPTDAGANWERERDELEAEIVAAIEGGGEDAYRKAWSAAMRTEVWKHYRLYFVAKRDAWLTIAREVDKRQAPMASPMDSPDAVGAS
jgi:hypothetical protein